MQHYIILIPLLKRQKVIYDAEGVKDAVLHICLKRHPTGKIGVPQRDCSGFDTL
jgi:hypothetical protein